MPVMICMLRGVNVGPHNRMKMDALRQLCESLELRDAQTYIQSGNVIFRTSERSIPRLSKRVQEGIERRFGFRPDVVFRTTGELRGIVERNPFSTRRGIDPSKLLVVFLADEPTAAAVAAVSKIECEPDEIQVLGREVYIYYRGGMARPKVVWTTIMKKLETTGTGRNWNSVVEMLALAEKFEASR